MLDFTGIFVNSVLNRRLSKFCFGKGPKAGSNDGKRILASIPEKSVFMS